MKKHPTLSIGIPAYNETANIRNLLEILLDQKKVTYSLKEIAVYSDGGTDDTQEIVKKMSKKYPLIRLINDGKRKGKYARVSEMFLNCKTDILIILDADIIPKEATFIDKLIAQLIVDPKAMMVAAHNVLLRPHTFIGKVIHMNFTLWDNVRLSVPGYDHAANFYGSATAYRGSFIRKVSIPLQLSDPHLFIYLIAKKVNGFRYARSAEVLQYPLTTMNDFKKFLNRSIGKKDVVLEKMFNVRIEDVYFFPRSYKVKGLLKTFFWQPFYTPLAILLSFYVAKCLPVQKASESPVWDITTSSKKLITYAKK